MLLPISLPPSPCTQIPDPIPQSRCLSSHSIPSGHFRSLHPSHVPLLVLGTNSTAGFTSCLRVAARDSRSFMWTVHGSSVQFTGSLGGEVVHCSIIWGGDSSRKFLSTPKLYHAVEQEPHSIQLPCPRPGFVTALRPVDGDDSLRG